VGLPLTRFTLTARLFAHSFPFFSGLVRSPVSPFQPTSSLNKVIKCTAPQLPHARVIAHFMFGSTAIYLANRQKDYATLQKRFPTATIRSSTFDAFFTEANKPEVKRLLPVVTQEIGDGWLYGVPSDPLKNVRAAPTSDLFGVASSPTCTCTSVLVLAPPGSTSRITLACTYVSSWLAHTRVILLCTHTCHRGLHTCDPTIPRIRTRGNKTYTTYSSHLLLSGWKPLQHDVPCDMCHGMCSTLFVIFVVCCLLYVEC
jgi:hypothetical protein